MDIIQIDKKESIEKSLTEVFKKNNYGLAKDFYHSFTDLLDDRKSLINWENYPGKTRLIGSCLLNNPPLKIPEFPKKILPILEAYKIHLQKTIIPLKITKNDNPQHYELFETMILLLVDSYPAYQKKDNIMKMSELNRFAMFIEDYPISIITKEIQSWIREENEYPTISKLIIKIENTRSKIKKRLDRIHKIIEVTGGTND